MDKIIEFLIANPFWLVFLFVAIVVAMIVGGTLYLKLKAPNSQNCTIEPCFYKDKFNEGAGDIKNLATEINTGNKLIEATNKKIEDNAKEHREAFAQLIAKSERQNEVLAKISTQLDMQNQLLLSKLK